MQSKNKMNKRTPTRKNLSLSTSLSNMTLSLNTTKRKIPLTSKGVEDLICCLNYIVINKDANCVDQDNKHIDINTIQANIRFPDQAPESIKVILQSITKLTEPESDQKEAEVSSSPTKEIDQNWLLLLAILEFYNKFKKIKKLPTLGSRHPIMRCMYRDGSGQF